MDAIRRFRAGGGTEADVVDAVRAARLLIPLVARLGEPGKDEPGAAEPGAAENGGAENGRGVKTQELSIVTVSGPDGRDVLPVFSSVATMGVWNENARPVPADGVRVALAAASEQTDIVVLDPTSETEFVIRRPALWALARDRPWTPSYADPAVATAFEESVSPELAVLAVSLTPGDPMAQLAGPELVVRLEIIAGLTQAELDAVLARLAQRWAASDVIATGVDSLTVQLVAST